jgi:predicted RNase H-like nuclease (RuvC/YqgF family)
MIVADHGIAVNDSDLDNTDLPDGRELESKLRDRTRAHEASQREIEELTRRCHEAEDKVESLGRLVDRIKDARSPTAMSMRSPTPPGDDPKRADYEARVSEIETKHQEKVKQLESDYQTAVRYVKGSEKMLKRMKVGHILGVGVRGKKLTG